MFNTQQAFEILGCVIMYGVSIIGVALTILVLSLIAKGVYDVWNNRNKRFDW